MTGFPSAFVIKSEWKEYRKFNNIIADGAGCTILFKTDALVEGERYGLFYIWKSSGALKFRCFFAFPWILKFC